MAYPTDDGEFILDTDASLDTVGAVLSQVQDGVEHVIAYGSRTLSKPEQNYCVTDQDLLAVRFFMEYYKHYLLGDSLLPDLTTKHESGCTVCESQRTE